MKRNFNRQQCGLVYFKRWATQFFPFDSNWNLILKNSSRFSKNFCCLLPLLLLWATEMVGVFIWTKEIPFKNFNKRHTTTDNPKRIWLSNMRNLQCKQFSFLLKKKRIFLLVSLAFAVQGVCLINSNSKSWTLAMTEDRTTNKIKREKMN